MRTIVALLMLLPLRLFSHPDCGNELHLAGRDNCTFAVDIIPSLPQWSVMCPGDLLTLTASQFGGTAPFTYLWSNGEITESITMTIPPFGADFTVTVTDANGCTGTDFIHLKYFEWTANITIEFGVFCTGQTQTLYASLFPFSETSEFEWSTGENTAYITISSNGTYSVTITDPNMPCPFVTGSVEITSFVNAPAPVPEISGTTELCPGGNGTLTASGGPFETYVWFPTYGSETEVLEITDPGTYILFVTNAEGCQGVDTFVVNEEAPQVILNDPDPICEGQSTVVEVVNASFYESFLWSTGDNTPSITVSSPGFYSVTVYSPGGCTSLAEVYVESSGTLIELFGTPVPVTSCTNPNGAIDLDVLPSGNYTFMWSNGEITEDLTGLTAGIYSVTATDDGGCSATSSFTVESNTSVPDINGNITHTTCDLPNGSIDLTVSPPGPYAFTWSSGQMTEDLTSIPAGTYLVTVTDIVTGCTSEASFQVTNSNISLSLSANVTPVTSCMNPNGAIDLTIVPNGTYVYSWSNGEITEDLQNLSAGNYTVTVSAGGSCTSSSTYTVPNSNSLPTLTLTAMPSSCGQSNGSVDLSIMPGGTYGIVWSNGFTTEDLFSVSSGTYSVTVTDLVTSCTSSAETVVMNDQINIAISGTTMPDTSCSGATGAVNIQTDPVGGYQYIWSNGETTEDIMGLTAGTYSVTATLGSTCTQSASFIVTDEPAVIILSGQVTPNSSCDQPNGVIDLTPDPLGTYTYFWSNGQVTEDISMLTGGTYSVTVTNADGCTATASFDVTNTNSNYSVSADIDPNTSCIIANGSVDLTLSPPGTYVFTWTNGAMTEDIYQMNAGLYGVTVSDVNHCSSVLTYTIIDSLIIPGITAAIVPSNCGMPDGRIDITVNPSQPLRFTWSNGATSEDQAGLLPGTYFITVTDTITGCAVLDTFTVSNINSNFSVSPTTLPNTSCTSPNGSIDLNVTPAGVYVFSWSNGAMTEDLSGLAAGTYTVTITDASLCATIESYVIIDNTPGTSLTAVITPASCGQSNGAIALTTTPSAGNTFLWSGGQVTEDITDLFPGTYTVTVTGQNGCVTIDNFLVTAQGSSFTLSGNTTPNTSCILSSGAIDLTVSPSGAYSYSWSNGQVTEDISGLAAGQYTVTVTDLQLCASSATYVVADQSESPVILATITPSTCGNPNGAIALTVEPAGIYQYSWSTGAVSEDLVNILAGQYSLTVTGPGGCSADTLLEVSNTGVSFSLSAVVSGNTGCSSANGNIDLSIIPAGNYSVLWSTGDTSEDLLHLSEGIYSVSVTDISGCSTSEQYVVQDQTTPLTVESLIIPAQCGQPNGAIYLQVTPDTGNTFLWSNGMQSGEIEDLLPGTYEITITNSNGCTWSSSFQVEGNSSFEIQLEANTSTSQAGYVTITLTLNIDEGAIDTILWSPGDLFFCPEKFCLEQTIPYPLSRTEINVLVIDTNGCQNRASLTLESLNDPEVFIPNVFSPNGDGINDLFTVYGNKDVELVDVLQIFDRWGNQVFINTSFPPNDERHGWDGTFKKKEMNPAVFAYWARVLYKDGTTGSFRGDVTLVK